MATRGLKLGSDIACSSVIARNKLENQEKASKPKLKQLTSMNIDLDFDSDDDHSPQGKGNRPQRASQFEEQYQIGEKVGEGAHAVVKECVHRQTGERLAVKS